MLRQSVRNVSSYLSRFAVEFWVPLFNVSWCSPKKFSTIPSSSQLNAESAHFSFSFSRIVRPRRVIAPATFGGQVRRRSFATNLIAYLPGHDLQFLKGLGGTSIGKTCVRKASTIRPSSSSQLSNCHHVLGPALLVWRQRCLRSPTVAAALIAPRGTLDC